MKRLICLLIYLLSGNIGIAQPNAFVTIWKTDNQGITNDRQIVIPVNYSYSYYYNIEWESIDGISHRGSLSEQKVGAVITFPEPGIYRVSITGDFPHFNFNNMGDKSKLIEVVNWGDIAWESFENSFYGCDQMQMTATDAPDLSRVINMESAFRGASKFNGAIGHWDVSKVSNMRFMFNGAVSFNQPLENWDVSSVTTMYKMFEEAEAFNQTINSWNVSLVTDMSRMFYKAIAFNQPLEDWNVSSVLSMTQMFFNAQSFNQPLNNWDVSKVRSMSGMFGFALNFNQPLNDWNVREVIDMSVMFNKAISFNQSLTDWNVSKVKNMSYMFNEATSFNQPLIEWDISNVELMRLMFYKASSFDQDLITWDFENCKDLFHFVSHSGMSTENYDRLLHKLFSMISSLPDGIIFGSEGLFYCAGEHARGIFITDKKWIFLDQKKCSQTIDFAPLSDMYFGEAPITLTATSSSGLPITYTSSNSSVATVSGSTLTLVGIGTTEITASQAGDQNYYAASDVTQPLTVAKRSQSITFDPFNHVDFNVTQIELLASASSGLPVTYSSSDENVVRVNGTALLVTGVGTAIITASQSGNEYYAAAEDVNRQLTVNKATQTITFESLSPKIYGDAPVELQVSASSGLPVSYSSSDESVATISGNVLIIKGVGNTIITATQSGNENYEVATNVEQPFTVNKASQTITFESLSPKTYGDAPVELQATASSGLVVNYNSSDERVASINGNMLTIKGAGSATITASQAGNKNNLAAQSVIKTLTVNKKQQILEFGPIDDQAFESGELQLTAASNSGLDVTYSLEDANQAIIEGNVVKFTTPGTLTITASQMGNENYLPADPITQTFEVYTITGAESEIVQTLLVYPNPVKDRITIQSTKAILRVELLDLKGVRLEILKPDQQGQIEFPENYQGEFLLRVVTQDGIAMVRVVKD